MRLELVVKLRFKATHTLEENEKVHEHEWRVDTTLVGRDKDSRVVSLPLAQELFRKTLDEIRHTHLNTSPVLDPQTRETPTCENLCYFLLGAFSKTLTEKLPEQPWLKISQIEVGVSEDDGHEMGAARLSI